MKEKCAQLAFEMIEDGMLIGLGGGSTVALIIDKLAKSSKNVTVITASYETKMRCKENEIPIQELEDTALVSLAFDGCDEVDANLNALKSCGGIHTREKILAQMAESYILLADDSKYHEKLAFAFPICLEVLPSSYSFIKKILREKAIKLESRKGQGKVGLVISDDGNYLMDAYFEQVDDLEDLAKTLDSLPGLVGHSLFYKVASKVIIAKENDKIIKERKSK